MKMKVQIIAWAVAAVGFIAAPNGVQASLVTYNWVPDTTKSTFSSPIGANPVDSSGTLTYDTALHSITSFSFTYGNLAADDLYVSVGFFGTFQLFNGDLALNGYSTDSHYDPLIVWANTFLAPPDENSANPLIPVFGTPVIFGDWVQASTSGVTPVPEPTTVVAGGLMLLPFGLGAVRAWRRNRTV